jgi:hypothetical protein
LDQEQFGLFEALTGWRMKAKPKNGLVKHQTIQTSNLAKIDGASSARSTYSKFEQEISDGNVQMKSENSWKESEHSFAGGNWRKLQQQSLGLFSRSTLFFLLLLSAWLTKHPLARILTDLQPTPATHSRLREKNGPNYCATWVGVSNGGWEHTRQRNLRQ